MSVVVPTILFLIALVAIGASATNYAGMTPNEALDFAKNNHDYTCSDSAFQEFYDDWHDMALANKPITYQDIQNVLSKSDDLYGAACEYGGMFLDEVLGSFDSSWTAVTTSRSIEIYDESGALYGSCSLVGCTNTYFDGYQLTMPQLNENGTYLVWHSVKATGEQYYHIYLEAYEGGGLGNGALWRDSFGGDNYFTGQNASNVYLTPNSEGSWWGYHWFTVNCYANDSLRSRGARATPYVMTEGNSSFVEPEQESIGTATLPDSTTAQVRPDGSIKLPDGTIVYPSTVDGTYPVDGLKVQLDDDYWKKLSDLLSQNENATGDTVGTGDIVTNLNLEGIRSQLASINDYLRNDLWADFANVFKYDPSKYNTVNYDTNFFGLIETYARKIMSCFGLNAMPSGGGTS